jgi:hypothetical protein
MALTVHVMIGIAAMRRSQVFSSSPMNPLIPPINTQ